MPPSLKDKGGRLLAFANGGPRTNEAQSGVDVKPTKSEPPRNVPTAPIPRPTSYPREITGLGGRNTAPPKQNYPFSQPPPHHSPVRSTISSPDGRIKADSSDRRVDIFSGSQLDENFMESGLTTPHNEPSDPVKLGPELTRDLKKTIPSHRLPDRNRFHRPPPTSDLFTVGDDLRMNVVSRSQQHNADHMGDGFQDDVNVRHGKLNGHHGHGRTRPDSPARQDSKIPMREVRIRKSHSGRSEAYDTNQARNISPRRPETQRQTQWQTHYKNESSRQPTVHHLDDEDAESASQEEEHTTPRPKPAKPVVQRTLLESSMPATTNFMSNTSRLDRKRRRPSPEYDDVALDSMTFASLRQQPFDFDPSKDGQKGTGVNADNLEDKLEHFRHLGEKEQHDLFSNMSMENWETSGEWFVHEFSALMQKLLDSRRQKRKIIQEFEQEAANREEAVRLKTQAIDRKLSKMKQDGQRVVEDKTA
ncbi:hypothetical protein BFJ66_g7302 [Fusarium oxysporum f. sp. cepae]|uniref:Extracellular mutant protein 11 C-terminal domain-containing protein n=1 Tax=Fusarium oxysporum f. sp. cepae TaxID=396571 RepID=A0A3L6NIP3_FUSOX|nr:hypothetical protein BFJ65_g7917 [Fusarium oxysporum f. sp. cepae]RKK45728.1 hypothetical protein BFJ67_g8577 [Fusarium oxysporum f. sp. cepae]RKK48953.1 hypothetical protein BFJ66_g7302 [Fusarium oxysporum f. sp. cepae]